MKNPFEIEKNYFFNQQMNDLNFWYPILKKVGIPTPETFIIKNNIDLLPLLDGEKPQGIDKLIEDIDFYANKVGYPCFIRTGQTSNKHNWKDSCYLEKKEDIIGHLNNLQEFSVMADMFSPRSMETIVVRKILNTKKIFTSFNDMPITKEIRIFIKDGEIESIHPYWPLDAFIDYNIENIENKIKELSLLTKEDKFFFKQIGSFLSKVLDGYWSIDFLQTLDGEWFCIDMARGENSYKNKEFIILD